ncbi:kinase-like domain-containing protein [Phycomyces nitens]|nr:kinase-like domain-containing protein [Phycomyces nitens]
MSLLSQIKNFLRSSKNATDGSSLISQRKARKLETAARIVEEENIAKQRMPTYRGLERYKLIKKLGDGAFSNVFKALDTQTQENVAVKVVRKFELNRQQRASVLKEAQIMRTTSHPSIVELKNFIETEDHFFLVLELCQGGELFHQIVRLTYLSEDLARHCIGQVAEAIRYLHESKGVVHRDIKPENLLFEPIPIRPRPVPPRQDDDEPKEDEGEFIPGIGGGGIGQVKIADFGLSKVVWNSHTMTPCGTVGYTAPEIVRDERYSKSVDMWALGCVLYTLLCGFPPFYDESIQMLTEKVARGHYTFMSPWWDHVSKEATDLISHLLCFDPEKRYTIDQFLQDPWMQKAKSAYQHSKQASVPNTPHNELSLDCLTTPNSQANTPSESPSEAELFKQSILNSGPPTPTNQSDAPPDRRRDLFSGISSMKEVLDLPYTVHREAEEKKWRKTARNRQKERQQAGNSSDPKSIGFREAIEIARRGEEDDSTENDLTADETSVSSSASEDHIQTNNNHNNNNNHNIELGAFDKPNTMIQQLQRERIEHQIQRVNNAKPIESKEKSQRKAHKPFTFELNMGKATLLDKRKKIPMKEASAGSDL